MALPKYIVNFDELTDMLKHDMLDLINDEIRHKYPQINYNNLESSLETLKSLLPYEHYKGLKTRIDNFMYKNITGFQKVNGSLLDVPPLIKKTQYDFKFDKDVYLTGLHFNQTGWKKQDRYTLEIDKNKIINNATIKEIGEHKYFNTFLKVNANVPVSFILDNKSGNSRQTMIDLEYIEGTESTIIVDPPTNNIDIKDIPNEWDIAVLLNWEGNTSTDMDLHGYVGNKHIYFGNKSDDGCYLNFDFKNHLDNSNPEILSVKGHKNEKLTIYIHNYNSVPLSDQVNIKIYHKGSLAPNLIREFKIKVEGGNNQLIGVCVLDLNTLMINEIDTKIKTINGGI